MIFRVSGNEEGSASTDASGGLHLVGVDSAYNLNKLSFKLDLIACMHIGDIVTSIQPMVVLSSGCTECILMSTLNGQIISLFPFASKKEFSLFQSIELHLRSSQNSSSSLIGREHGSYRSYYQPVKNILDGDLIESYKNILNDKEYNDIAQSLDRNKNEIYRLIEEIRNRII